MFQIQVLKFLKSQYIPRVWYDKGQKKKKKSHLQNLNILRWVLCLVESGITCDVWKYGFDCAPLP